LSLPPLDGHGEVAPRSKSSKHGKYPKIGAAEDPEVFPDVDVDDDDAAGDDGRNDEDDNGDENNNGDKEEDYPLDNPKHCVEFFAIICHQSIPSFNLYSSQHLPTTSRCFTQGGATE
jgi:hypothetical protein